MEVAEYKRQHTVNESYLRRFIDPANDLLCQCSKENGDYVWIKPGDATIGKYIYSFRRKDGSWNHAAELELGRIEGTAMPILDKLQFGHEISHDERFNFSMFVGAMYRRTRHLMDHFDDAIDAISAGPGSMMSLFEKELPRLQEKYSTEQIEDTKAKIASGEVKASKDVAKAAHLRVWFKNLPRHALNLANMHWQVWKAAKGHSFLTTDAPAFVRREGKPDDPGIVGVERADLRAELTFPLSPTHLLMMKHTPCPPQMHASKSRVRELNALAIRMAHRFIFVAQPSDGTRQLVQRNNGFAPPLPAFLDMDGQLIATGNAQGG